MDRHESIQKKAVAPAVPKPAGKFVVLYCTVVASIFKAVFKKNGRTAYAAAKVMIPSRAPDPLSTAFPCVARFSLYP